MSVPNNSQGVRLVSACHCRQPWATRPRLFLLLLESCGHAPRLSFFLRKGGLSVDMNSKQLTFVSLADSRRNLTVPLNAKRTPETQFRKKGGNDARARNTA